MNLIGHMFFDSQKLRWIYCFVYFGPDLDCGQSTFQIFVKGVPDNKVFIF